jgi:hypothetical protein
MFQTKNLPWGFESTNVRGFNINGLNGNRSKTKILASHSTDIQENIREWDYEYRRHKNSHH